MIRRRLKGGSLAGTYLVEDGDRLFVRKEVSLTQDREFGFQRWYSQLKRLARFETQFPGVFPRVLDVGREGDTAFFDLEYIADALTAQEYLLSSPTAQEVAAMFDAFISTLDRMHEVEIAGGRGAMDLYIYEEVERKIALCTGHPAFEVFAGEQPLSFNRRPVVPLLARLDEFRDLARRHATNTRECFTHGNVTLENVLYVPGQRRIVFIDPYEENIVDSMLNEYSQVLQSCNAYYEVYNAATPVVRGRDVVCPIASSDGLDAFARRFGRLMQDRLTDDDAITMRLFEVSQFMRMLPFKMAIDPSKMALFYALGSHLFDLLVEDIEHGRREPTPALAMAS